MSQNLRAGRREWIGLAVLALPTFLVAIDVLVLTLALPSLARDLDADSNQQLWIVDIYGFMLAGFLLTMGSLGDRIGRRRLLLIGAAVFAVASVLISQANSAEMLIACRALLGIAGATLMPSTLALITTMFHDPKQRATAFGVWGGTFTVGMIVGPIAGGLLLSHLWWGSVFLIAVPVTLVLLVVGPAVLPEYRNENPGRLDALSVVLSLTTILPVIWGIKALARDGWGVLPLLAIAVGLGAALLFGRRQRQLADPLIDLGLFGNRAVSTALGAQLAYSTVGGGLMLFMMLYFQIVAGMSALGAGLAMIPGMAAATVGFSVAPKLASRYRPAYVIAAGMAGMALVLASFTMVSGDAGSIVLIVGFAVFSFCGAPLVALGTNLIVGSAPPEKAGSAGSMANMSNEFGGTLGGALFGILGFAVYRALIDGDVPADVPGAFAAAAADSAAGAAAAAAELPGPVAANLLAVARDAFTGGINVVAGTGSVIIAVMAVVVAVMLRHVPPIGQEEQPAEPAPGPAADPAGISREPAADHV